MFEQKKISTKDKILRNAARMFSERGYDRVTTREIASSVGINSASIYYYFSSKDEILKSLYRLYTEEQNKKRPDLNELLRLVEIAPPHEVLMKSEYHYDEEIREFLDQILVTATRGFLTDLESERFLQESIFGDIMCILKPLLERMVELGKIKPFKISVFLRVLCHYCYSAAALNSSPFKQSVAEFQEGMSLLFSLIAPVQ